MKRSRLWLMLAAMLLSSASIHAMSPSVASLQALQATSCDQCNGCAQAPGLLDCCEGMCPASANCPVLNASACWLTQAVQQSLTGWKQLCVACAGSDGCCDKCDKEILVKVQDTRTGSLMVGGMPDCCAGSCVTGCPKACAPEAKCATGSTGPTAALSLQGKIVFQCQEVTPSASCSCTKECGCCESCKTKKTTSTMQSSCCPIETLRQAIAEPHQCVVPVAPGTCFVLPPPPPLFAPVPPPMPGAACNLPAIVGPKVIALISDVHGVSPALVPAARANYPMAMPPARRAHLTTDDIDAHCDQMAHKADMVMLEGNVQLVCRKNGQNIRIEAHRVMLNTKTGTFTVESNVPPTPHVIWRGAVDSALPAPAETCIIYTESPSSAFQPQGYRMIHMLQSPALELLVQPPPPFETTFR